jgi:hypothetical protein
MSAMDAQQFDELASRWIGGDRLARDEEQRLLDWLDSHPDARDALLEDESLDSLLRSWPQLADTSDDFVQGCVRRISGERADNGAWAAVVEVPPIIVPPRVAHSERQAEGVLGPENHALRLKLRACHPVRSPLRRPFLGKAVRWTAAIAGCCAALVLAAVGWRWLAGGRHAAHENQLVNHAPDSRSPQPEPPGAFATLAQCAADAAWDAPHSAGDRLAAGELRLTAGTVDLHLDKGSVVRLTAPATLALRSVDEVFLTSGRLSAQVPPPAVGFAVATPLARIVDLGTEFDVTVKDSGAIDTLVRRGRVSLRPQIGQEPAGEPIELAAGALDTATVSAPAIAAEVLPVATVARGGGGRFLGRMTAQGKTADFHSQADFDAFRVRAFKQLGEAPAQFAQKWPGLVAAAKSGNLAENYGAVEHPAAPPRKTVPARPIPEAGNSAGNNRNTGHGAAGEEQSVEIEENGKKVSISDTKESGITVTITESVNGKKETTKVRAADTADLAKKNPEAHKLYRKYFHPRPKNGKPK